MFLLLLAMSSMVFCKDFPGWSFPHFYGQIKQKTGNIGSINPSRITNAWKIFEPNKPKGQPSFWEVKILGWFTIYNYNVKPGNLQ